MQNHFTIEHPSDIQGRLKRAIRPLLFDARGREGWMRLGRSLVESSIFAKQLRLVYCSCSGCRPTLSFKARAESGFLDTSKELTGSIYFPVFWKPENTALATTSDSLKAADE